MAEYRRYRRPSLLLIIAFLALVSAAPICGPADPQPTPEPSTPTVVAAAEPEATPAATDTAPPNTGGVIDTASLPSPSSQADTMLLGGDLWVDARPAFGEVLAFVGGKQCGRGQSGGTQSDPPSPISSFFIQIASDAATLGCGVPGAPVALTINGRFVTDTILWQPGMQQPVSLIAGPAFASYYGTLLVDGITPPLKVFPYIDGALCGADLSPMAVAGQKIRYHVVVDPEELRPGCGRAGTTVTLRLLINGQPDIVLDTAQWSTGAAVQRPSVDLAGRIPTSPLPASGAQ